MMKRSVIVAFVLLCLSVVAVFSQGAANSNIVKKDLSPAEIDRIIKRVTENESNFRSALTN